MKTVLLLSSSSGPGGAERVLSGLAASLDRRKFRPVVGLFRPGWLKEQCEKQGISTHVMSAKGILDWRWIAQCIRLIRKENVGLIHAHEFDANVNGTLAAFLTGIPIVTTVHGKHYYWQKLRRRWAYRMVSRYAHMVAVSEDLKRFISAKVGVVEGRIDVIYNGIDLMPTIDEAEIQKVKAELGLGENEPIIGTVGSLYPVKGHKYLLAAIPLILKEQPSTKVLIVGRGDLEVPLKDEVKRLGLDRHVSLLGLRQDIPRLLALMDVFVLPSLSEGLSMALLEAMAAERPVVATEVGGNPEVILHGENGLLIAPEDSTALARSILMVLSDKERAKRWGEAGRNRVEKCFSSKAMVGSYQKVYESFFAELH